MSSLCQQCRHSVPSDSLYCGECGAPQLHITRGEEHPSLEQAAPQPQHSGGISWPAALRSSLLFAVPAGVLLTLREGRGLLELIWVAAAAYMALRWYRRYLPQAPAISPKIGGRIGMLVGLIAICVNLMGEAARMCVERFLLHQGGAIDADLHTYAQMEVELIRSSDPETAARLGWLTHFWLSPEGAATLLLLSLGASTVFVLFFGWLSGRFSARYVGARLRRAR